MGTRSSMARVFLASSSNSESSSSLIIHPPWEQRFYEAFVAEWSLLKTRIAVLGSAFVATSYLRDLSLVVQRLQPQEPRRSSQLFLNPQQLVVFCDPVRTRSGPGLNLPRSSSHRQIGDERIFRLARPVRDHGRVSIPPREINRIQSLAHRSDLIHLDQNRVGYPLIDSFLQELNVGDENVVAHQLNLPAEFLGQVRPAVPIILRQPIFQRHNGIVIHPLRPETHHLIRTLRRLVRLLEDILSVLIELAGCRIER